MWSDSVLCRVCLFMNQPYSFVLPTSGVQKMLHDVKLNGDNCRYSTTEPGWAKVYNGKSPLDSFCKGKKIIAVSTFGPIPPLCCPTDPPRMLHHGGNITLPVAEILTTCGLKMTKKTPKTLGVNKLNQIIIHFSCSCK